MFFLVVFLDLVVHIYQTEQKIFNSLTTKPGVVSLMNISAFYNTNGKTKLNPLEKQNKMFAENTGTGCELPSIDPFGKEILKYDKKLRKLECPGEDWVKCNLSQCKVTSKILSRYKNITCKYNDVIFEERNNLYYTSSTVVYLNQSEEYKLEESDHVMVKCWGSKNLAGQLDKVEWFGYASGFRSANPPSAPPGHEDNINVLILGFHSTSMNSFIRKMPYSYKFLKEELRAIFLTKYSVIGDTKATALFPMLTGKAETEMSETLKSQGSKMVNHTTFLFYKFKLNGYRTMYLDDMPPYGTFTPRHNAFDKRPSHHTLWDLLVKVQESRGTNNKTGASCLGDTPQYKFMLDKTAQFFKLNRTKFCFTFISDLTQEGFNEIGTADHDLVKFLDNFRKDGHLNDALVIIMSDHGDQDRKKRLYQAKLEALLPLMAIILPPKLKQNHPDIASTLRFNADVLTTPHDIYATILDAANMSKHWNLLKVNGSNLYRGMSLFKPIPRNRSCGDAGILPQWCLCHNWIQAERNDSLFNESAEFVVDYINKLTKFFRFDCEILRLAKIVIVEQFKPKLEMLRYNGSADEDGYEPLYANQAINRDLQQRLQSLSPADFKPFVKLSTDYLEILEIIQSNQSFKAVEITVDPGNVTFAANLTYSRKKKQFVINRKDITRVSASDEKHCLRSFSIRDLCVCRMADLNNTLDDSTIF